MSTLNKIKVGDNIYEIEDSEARSKLEGLGNISGNASDIRYVDEYGYGTPDNVQDALNYAFEELDNKTNYEDLEDFISFNSTQTLNSTQKKRARNNIGALGITELGEIDVEEYDGDISTFFDTLTEEGIYRLTDNGDCFDWLVEVYWIGSSTLGQTYRSSEEGFSITYYRDGCYNEEDDTYTWSDWVNYLTYDVADSTFAKKAHAHFTAISTALDIRTYLDKYTNYAVKDLRVTCSTNKRVYMVRVDYNNYTLDGETKHLRYQEYYDIEEPNRIYKRKGYDTSGHTSTNITWEDWCVFEDSATLETYCKEYIDTQFSTVLDSINGEVV